MQLAILCANGLGDGLLMMIIANNFSLKGHSVTIFHENFALLSPLFPNASFQDYPPLSDFEKTFREYELVVVENDHSEKAWKLFALREQKILSNITFLFPTPYKKTCMPRDFTFNTKIPVASNLVRAAESLLQATNLTKDNGIEIPKSFIHKKYPKRVVIHPTSKDPKRNWKKSQFMDLAKKLTENGFSVFFAVSIEEKKDFTECTKYPFPEFSSFFDLACFIYESGYLIGNDSGLGHLASNLQIPTVTISGNPKRVRLWRPDFAKNQVATIPFPLPNFKGINFRVRERYWQNFISVSRVWKKFKQLTGTL